LRVFFGWNSRFDLSKKQEFLLFLHHNFA